MAAPFACDGSIYQVVAGLLQSFDPLTSSYRPVGMRQAAYNAIGYNTQDNFIYGMQSRNLVRLHSDGSLDVLNNLGLISNSGDGDGAGNLWLKRTATLYSRVNIATQTVSDFTVTEPPSTRPISCRSGLFERTAASLTVGYTTDKVRAGTGVEVRSDRGPDRQQTVWLFRNSLDYAVDPDWRAIGRLNFAFADEGSPSVNAANFVKAVVGMAFRPVENERVNGLVRLTCFRDLGPVGQVTGGGTIELPKQVSKVANVDFNFDLSQHLTLGLK